MEASEHVWRSLGSVLVAQCVVTTQEVEEALAEQKRSGERLGEILIARGYVSRTTIRAALASQAGLLLDPAHDEPTGSDDIPSTLLEQVRQAAAAPPTQEDMALPADDSTALFLATVGRARRYLADRRAALEN
ncbi:MAG: hypothetical protein ACXVH1_27805 [Solirubrobacteraceae bacterium]